MKRVLASALATLLVAGCAPADDDVGETGADLDLGDVSPDDMKADGQWGSALTCKTIPSFPALTSPTITISIEGLTVHLQDTMAGYDKVFPMGSGQIDTEPGTTLGESLSMWPVKAYKKNQFYLTPATNTACKTWWTDPETGEKLPVFAGLPFLSWSGSYAMHGPIDNFRAPNGGNLRRGFVSHGCIRMESADILEIYARIKNVAKVPVWVQREPERLPNGERVDVKPAWIGTECDSDADCNFADGFCHANPYSQRGFCTARCTKFCTDKAGYPTTFCVTDPDAAGQGMCVNKVSSVISECRNYDHFEPMVAGRNTQATVTANVCIPGSQGAIGDHCFMTSDCDAGNVCAGATGAKPGLCTQACTKLCPDPTGVAGTFCVNEAALGGPKCMRTCTPGKNAPECPGGTQCVERSRNNEPATKKFVCEPV